MTDLEKAVRQALDALGAAHIESLDGNNFACRQILAAQIIELSRALAHQAEPVVERPQRRSLTDEERRAMWQASDFRGNGGQRDWFIEGIRAAEVAHGITKKQGLVMPPGDGSGSGTVESGRAVR